MKRIKILMLMLVVSLASQAQTNTQKLVVWMKDGQKVYFDLTEKPRTTFENGLLIITTNTVQTSYQRANIIRYTYDGYIPNIDPSSITQGNIVFRQGNNRMSFDGLPDGTRIELYSLDGKMLSTQQASSGQTAVVSLENQPTGTYIIKVNDASYKFMKR